MGRTLIAIGVVLVLIGVIVEFTPLRLGRLPGDIRLEGKNSAFYFPIVTCLVLSALATIVMWIVGRFR